MECLQGDTLGNFEISAKNGNFDNCRMQVIIAKKESPSVAIVCKECELFDGKFHVLISSDETANLSGMHVIHFHLIDCSGKSYRKIAGNLFVHKTAKGGF